MKRLFAAATLSLLLSGAPIAQETGAAIAPTGDAVAGEAVFKKCLACHAVGEGARNKVGPQLNGVMGRQAGTIEGYNYSNAMKEAGAGGLVWTEETLHPFLEAPRATIKGTKMAFAGLKDAKQREDVIAYLRTFSPDYVAPEVSPIAGEGAPADPAAAPAQ